MLACRPATPAIHTVIRSHISISTSRAPFSTSRVRDDFRKIAIAQLLQLQQQQQQQENQQIQLHGWIRSIRKQKRIAFAAIGDGSTIDSIQAVLKPEQAIDLAYGTAVRLTGSWKRSHGTQQSHELHVDSLDILGSNNAEFNPLQPKFQTPEFLRTIPHLRPRIPAHSLRLRLRSHLIASLTRFFAQEDFVQTHTPIITSSDCEGAGEVFTVDSHTPAAAAATTTTDPGFHHHFFKSPKYLTVSAQLHLEALAHAVGKVWTLSPTFRAERSETPRHLSEFYMLEAEMSFVQDLSEIMHLVENMLRAVATDLVASPISTELLRLHSSTHSRSHSDSHSRSHSHPEDALDPETLQSRWHGLLAPSWPRITYHSAITHLQHAVSQGTVTFEFPPTIKGGLHSEHERHLATSLGKGSPVFITHYPVEQKPFYMSRSLSSSSSSSPHDDINDNHTEKGDGTVQNFDLLLPSLCEVAGGSMRIHDSLELSSAMRDKGIEGRGMEWYEDLRKYGSVPHGGFGLGFDRLVAYLAGVGNLRDVVAWPRWVGRGEG